MPGHPLENTKWAEHLTEFVVIVALMGAGLKIDRPIGWRRWTITRRLLGIAMPLSIAAASALLLGAAFAPTDPVLAADVQIGPPQTGEEDDIRFALTSEAGLNDGLSFPFVMAAIAMAGSTAGSQEWVGHWLVVGVVWKLAAGLAMGWVVGRILGWLRPRFRKVDGSRGQATAWTALKRVASIQPHILLP